MWQGLSAYFFGAEEAAQSKGADGAEDGAEWIFVDQKSGRSSPVLVAEPEVMTIEEEDLQSVAGRQPPKSEVRRLRKLRREIAASEKKRQVRALIERRQQVEQQLLADPDNSEDSSATSSPAACPPPSPPKHLEKAAAASKAPVQRGKQKQRSKTGSKLCSGRSNDRKCNNIN
ncbi:hypothetical protein M3Y99_00797300 [Aphelenchoides fujianensis]|nr:hypothetical protein M3Y99_00797300 [Aphelenchoides fujianensis]